MGNPISACMSFISIFVCQWNKFYFISSHFLGKKEAENLALRDQELCVAAHLFAEEINTESDLVGENLATKGDELYFQDLPIYNKLNISSAKVGEKTAKEPQSVAPPPRRQQRPWASRTGSCSPCVTNFTNRLESYSSLKQETFILR